MKIIYILIAFVILLLFTNDVYARPDYPDSPIFSGITWDDVANVLRLADGSDNWPITWAEDDYLYGAGGDGFGCNGSGTKWSLWVGRFSGYPPNINCTDVATLYKNDGKSGEKGSGILSVNRRIYMWLRNANNNGRQCGLIYSENYGVSWSVKDVLFPEFGYCTFLNFGKNYSGSRDNYVYTYTHDNDNAYQSADHFVLMRVPKDKITDRNSYEYFSGTSANPNWSLNILERQPVFINTGNALRSGISYHAPSGRYLWWQQNGVNGPDTRFSGGFGIYDAPEPWGPWSIVFYTDNWDIGPGDGANFPTKWMSSDGKMAYLVFSGDDSFSIRKAIFNYKTPLPTPSSSSSPSPNASPTNTSSAFPTFTPNSTPTSAPDIPGDANGDEIVDGLDYLIWLINYNSSTVGGSSNGDFDNSGYVDGLDYIVWLRNYGSTAP